MSVNKDFKRATYTSDDGNDYTVKVDAETANDATLGFSAYDVAHPNLPKGYQMRYILAVSSAGVRRKVPVGSSTCDVWTMTATHVDKLTVGVALAVQFDTWYLVGEKRTVPHQVVNI